MVVSQTRTLIRALCEMRPNARDLLACANARLAEDLDAGSFVTAFAGFLSPDGVLEWCSAGHGPILLRTDAHSSFEALDATAPPLGVLPDFMADHIPPRSFGPGGVICISSDGIPEAFSPSGEQFGVERLIEILSAEENKSPQEMIASVQAAVLRWQEMDEPKDDQTLVIAMKK
jgi:sigma-B regulation protein RsbU (phosphoserine phosphatase)